MRDARVAIAAQKNDSSGCLWKHTAGKAVIENRKGSQLPACFLGTVPGRELFCDFAFAGLGCESFWPSVLRHSATLLCLTIRHDAVMKFHGPQEAVRMVIIVIITFTKPILCDRFHREMPHEIAKCGESSTLLLILQDSR